MNEVDVVNPSSFGGLLEILVSSGAILYVLTWAGTKIPNEDEIDNPALKIFAGLMNIIAANFGKNANTKKSV